MSSDPIHSTGRGGAGNIGKDTNTYVDGDIVREGTPGAGVGEYSAGRGGAGNIVHPTTNKPSEEIVPESATRPHVPGDSYDNFHTGRGGEGNVYKEKYGGHSSAKEEKAAGGTQKEGGLVEKLKHVVGLDKKEKTPEPK